MDINTFDDSNDGLDMNPLYKKQREGVAKMRTSLLACTEDNGVSVRHAIESITAMRVYHQLLRIIRYLEVMDKLEDKLYDSIDSTIDRVSARDPTTWMALLDIQERLQKNMIASHKLLEPYLDIQDFTAIDLTSAEDAQTPAALIMDSEIRDRLRTSAQAVLTELKTG